MTLAGVGDEDIRGWLDIVLYGLRNARLALEIVPEGTRNANVYIPIVKAIHQATNLAKGLHAGLQHRLSQREYRIAFHEVVKETHAKLKAAIPLLTIDYPSEQLNMVTPLVNVPVQDAVRTRAGLEVPTIGFGTHALASKPIADIANIVAHALATGYRRIDVYDDPNVETGVGRAIDAASRTMNLPRDKLFVSVKVQVGQGGEMDGFDEKLARLGLGYVDALLLAGELLAEMEYAKLGWATAEMAKASGKAKSIGVHDVDVVALEQLLAGDLRPELVQNRFWPLHQGSYENPEGTNVHQLCEAEGIVLDGYSTLSSHPHKLSFMNDPHVRRIGEKLGVSPAQLMLRWALQQGVAVSPSSSDKDHITGNFQLSDFEVSEEDVTLISGLAWFSQSAWNLPYSRDVYGIRPAFEAAIATTLQSPHAEDL